MAAAQHKAGEHKPGAPVLVRFADGPNAGGHMTVPADFGGKPPRVIDLGSLPAGPIYSPELGEPEAIPMTIVHYQLVATLDTVPWSYLYAIDPAAVRAQNGAPTA